MPPKLSPVCKIIDDEISNLKKDKQSLSSELQNASPGEKGAITSQIKGLNNQIAAKNKELTACIEKNPYVPPPKPKANPCLPIKKQIDKLMAALNKEIQNAVADLQAELKNAAPGKKSSIAAQIKKISTDIRKNSPTAKQIAEKIKAYNTCIKANGGLSALDATFKGTATLSTSNGNAAGPFNQDINIGLHFSDWDHRDVTVTSFPPISVTYDTGTPIGTVTTTISLVSPASGKFDPTSNSISLSLSLFFHHSTSFAGDSTLDIDLYTTSALSSTGKITVAGISKFKNGYLDNDTCWITVKGTISPHP